MTPLAATPHAWPRRALALAAGLALAAWSLRADAQPDLYFHLAAGRWIWAHGLPDANVFLATNPAHPFVDHEWVFQALIWPLWQLGGAPLLTLLKTLAATGALAATLHAADRRIPWRWLLVAPALVLIGPRLVIRPEVLSFLAAGLYLAVLARCQGRPSRAAIAGLVAVQVVWNNTHGFAVVGPACAAAAWVACLVHRGLGARGARFGPPGDPRALGLLAALSLGVGLLHPYGPAASFHPLRLIVDRLADSGQAGLGYQILEFLSPWDPTLAGRPEVQLYKGWLLVGLPLGALGCWRGRLRPEALAACAVLCVASTPYVRTLPFAGMALLVLSAAGLAALEAQVASALRSRRSLPAAPSSRPAPAAAVLAAGGLGVFAAVTAQGTFHQNADYDARAGVGLAPLTVYDEAVAFLRDHPPPGAVFNDFGSGHYLTWAGLEPRPFISGHVGLYPRRFYDDYLRLVEPLPGEAPLAHAARLSVALEAYGVSDVFLDHRLEGVPRTLVQALYLDPAWTLVFASPRAVVFRRADADATPAVDLTRLAAAARDRPYADESRSAFVSDQVLAALGLGHGLRPLERTHMARLLDDLGQPAAALTLIRSAVRLSDDFPPVLATAVALERRHGDPAQAAELLARWKAKRPDDAAPWLNQGLLALARGQARAARDALERARALDPGSYPVHHQLLAACDLAGDAVALRRALAQVPPGLLRPALLDFYRATAALHEHCLDEAIPAFERMLDAEPRHAEGLSRLGEALTRAGELDRAERIYARLCDVTPDDPVAWRNLGTVRSYQGETAPALTAWSQSADVDTREVRSLVFAGQLLREQGQPTQAADWVRRALRRDPQDPGARELARLLGLPPE